MNFLYQIVTSMYVYTLYEEPGEALSKTMKSYNVASLEDLMDILAPDLVLDKEDMRVLLHVKDLRNEKTRDFTKHDQILDVLFFDSEVTSEDYETVEELVSAYRHC